MLYSLQYFQQMYNPEKNTWNLQHLENSLSYNREWKPSRNWVRDYLSYDCCTVRSMVYVSTMVRKCGTFIFFMILWRNEREQTYELEANGSRDWTSRLWQRTSTASSDPARSRSTDIFTVRYRSRRSWGSLTGIRYIAFTPATIASRVNKGVVLIKQQGSNTGRV